MQIFGITLVWSHGTINKYVMILTTEQYTYRTCSERDTMHNNANQSKPLIAYIRDECMQCLRVLIMYNQKILSHTKFLKFIKNQMKILQINYAPSKIFITIYYLSSS